jgi:hypothetical protein
VRYLPFLDGKYSTAPGLNVLAKADGKDQLIFQLDDDYDLFIDNKLRCREEDIHKYFIEKELYSATAATVNRFIIARLTLEHPAIFERTGEYTLSNRKTGHTLRWEEDGQTLVSGGYINLLDALSSQVQEDIAICQLEGERDWLAAIHLSAPNHWDPAEKVGRPFSFVHGVVPGMEKLNQQYFKMLVTAVQKGPFFRFAWGLATDRRLNHHPIPPPGVDPVFWQGRRITEDLDSVYLRVERQTTHGFPDRNAFLFTIRTYFYSIDELASDEKRALLAAVETMSPASLEYKGLTGTIELLRHRLSTNT